MVNFTYGHLMSNITFSTYTSHLGYGSQGFVMCLGNTLLIFTILWEESLRKRKEMLLIAGLAAADLTYGLGALLLAIHRIIIISFGLQRKVVTAWDCVRLPPLFLTHIGAQLNAAMSLVMSVDRYIAVAHPLYFRTLGRNYARSVLQCVGVYGLVALTVMLTSTYLSEDQLTSNSTMTLMCSGSVFPGWYATYQFTFILLVGVLADLLYVAVFIHYKMKIRKIAPNGNDLHTMQQRGPYSVFAVAAWIGVPAPQPTLLGTLSRFSTIINILIFVIKQKEIREALKKIFRIK